MIYVDEGRRIGTAVQRVVSVNIGVSTATSESHQPHTAPAFIPPYYRNMAPEKITVQECTPESQHTLRMIHYNDVYHVQVSLAITGHFRRMFFIDVVRPARKILAEVLRDSRPCVTTTEMMKSSKDNQIC